MARRSSWFAVALVLALLFVTSHCLRGPATRDEIRDTTVRSRGVSRFSTKAAKGLETTPEPFTSTSRSTRRGTKITNRANTSIYQRSNDPKIETTEKNTPVSKTVTQYLGRRQTPRSEVNRDDLTRAASEDRRYLPEPTANRNSNYRNNNNRDEEINLKAPDVSRTNSRSQRNFPSRKSRTEFQRRSESVDPVELIDDVTEKSRFRSGRKIQTTPTENFKESSRFSSRVSSRTVESSSTSSERPDRVIKSDVRRSTERNLRRHDSDLSNSNQVNVGVSFSTEGSTAPSVPSRSRKALGRSRNVATDKSDSSLTSARGSRRISSKAVDRIDGNSLDESAESSTKRNPEETKSRKSLKSSESTSAHVTSSRRSRGRSLEPRSETSEKFKIEARSRDIASDKNKLDRRGRVPDKIKLVKSNNLGTGSPRSRSRSQTKQSVLSTTESSTEFATSTTLLEEATTLVPSTLQPTEFPSNRRASKSAIKTLPKEDFFNRGLGFRGRKFVTSSPSTVPTTSTTPASPSSTPTARVTPPWTLNRRPYFKNNKTEPSATTSNPTTPPATTISNEISSDPPSTTTNPRLRGNKVFNKASVLLKVNREIEESDNYPLEFKAKLAQLKNNSVKESGSESSSRVIKDLTSSRQTRSIKPTDPLGKHTDVNESSAGISSAILESYEANEGPKNLEAGNPSFVVRSREKLANARRQVKPDSESQENSSTSAASVDVSDSKKHRAPKRYSNSRLTTSSTTPETIVTVTAAKVDGSFSRTSKSVERGNTRVGETTRVRQYRKEVTPTTKPVIYSKVETVTENIKAFIKSTPTVRNNDSIATTEKPSTTTKRSRAWNAVHIDKNWQEPTTKSTSADKITTENPISSSSKPTQRPRHWNGAYIDKNWQEPTYKSTNAEKTTQSSISSSLKATKRPRHWNAAHADKNWQEPTRKPDNNTEITASTSSNKFEKKANKYSVGSSTEKFQPTTEKSLKVEDKLRRRDFRSRTATYRRHLVSPVSINSQEITRDIKTSEEWKAEVNKREKIQIVKPEPVEKKEPASVAITPRYHASIKTENTTQRSVKQEPALSLKLSNTTESKIESEGSLNSTGISSISRGSSGNSDSNIFNPTKSTYLISSNISLLEQLRSTVAPLLSVLGAKTPEFAAAYSNVNNASLSVPRVTPSGSPPRFSAKYRGVEFFVRKPSGTNSTGDTSTTPLLDNQAEKPSIPVSISSPGEPKVLTYYQALETVNINNEIDQHLGGVGKVDANAIVTDKFSNDSNNAYNFTTETIVTTVEPVVTIIKDDNNNDSDNDNDNLTVVMDSPSLDTTTQPEITTSTYTTTSSSTTSTQAMDISTSPPETTEINPSPFNPEFINNSSTEGIPDPFNTTPILVTSTNDNLITTEMNTEVSMTSEADVITTTQEVLSTSDETSTVSTSTQVAMEIIMASLENSTSVTESTTALVTESTTALVTESTTASVTESTTATSETMSTTFSTTDASIYTTEPAETTSTTEIITNALDTAKVLPDSLEVRSQLGETLSTESAVTMDQTSMATTEISSSSESFEIDQTTSTVETTLSSNDFNETSEETVTDAPDSINDELLSLMMKRLMEIFSLDEKTTLLKDISKTSNDTDPRMLGGFIDNRNLTDIDNDVGVTENLVEGSTTILDNLIENSSPTVQSPELSNEIFTTVEPQTTQSSTQTDSVNNKATTMSNLEIVTSNPQQEINEVDMTLTSTTYSSTDVTTNNDINNNNNNNNNNNVMTNLNSEITTTVAYSELADDTNVTTNLNYEIITTTLEPEVIKPTPNIETLDIVSTSPGDSEVTTNPSTTITTTRAPETTTVGTEDPNSVTTLQDEITSTAQTTASFQQSTTQLPPSTTSSPSSSESTTSSPSSSELTTSSPSSSESITTSIPSTTNLPSSTDSTLPIPTTTDSPSTEESTTIPTTTQSLTSPSSSSSLPSSSTMQTTTTALPETMTTASSSEIQSTNANPTESMSITTPLSTTTTTTTSTTPPTTAYAGRFGGSRMTPAPRWSSSSSTKTPLRDYHVYGIYPNKTIVRKRPEDNLIDARNIDSPYVIFGIYPDGKLVRKFPNGTVIPDPPSNPVEVVFSLSTSTTTNRPTPQTQVLLENNINNNQANIVNQQMNNNNGSATASSNNRPANMTLLTNISGDQMNDGYRSQINLGLSDNSINPNGADEDPNQFADPTLMPSISNFNTQPTTTTMITDASSRTAGPPLGLTPSSVNSQGGRIIQDIERDKASRTKEAGGQRSTVYIGQEKFINYWTNDSLPSNNSRISASNEGPGTSSLPSLDILTNNNIQGQGIDQANYRWKDPLDQIFGITTRPSVPSNTQDESRSAITARPINPLSEVFTPVLDANQLARDTSITITDATTNTIASSTISSSTSTTTTTPTTTTSTTTPTTTTTTTTPTTTTSTTTTTTTTTTAAPTTTSSTTPSTTTTTTTTTIPPTSTTTSRPTTTSTTTTFAPPTSSPASSSSPPPTTNTISESTLPPVTTIDIPRQTAFGTTFDDLAFLNSLLQSHDNLNSIGSTPKTLTEVERQLANKILSLALSKAAGPTRSPKAIQPSNISPNSLDAFPRASFGHSSSPPIIIDLLQPTSKKPVARITTSEPFTWKPVTDVTSTTPTSKTTSSKPTVSTSSTTTTTTSTSTSTSTTTPPSTTTTTSTTSTSSTTVTPSTQVTWKPFPTHPPTLKSVESIPVTKKQTYVKTTTGNSVNRPKSTTPAPLGLGASLLQAIFGRNIFAPATTQRPVIRRPPQTTKKPIVTTTSRPVQITELVIPTPAVRNQVQAASQHVDDVRFLNSLLKDGKISSSTFSPEDDAKFLLGLLDDTQKNAKKGVKGPSVLSQDDETFLRSILSGQAKVRTPSSVSGNSGSNNAALLAELLKVQGIEPSTPVNRLQEQLQGIKVTPMPIQSTTRVIATTKKSVTRPRPSDWQPSSTYPPPLFSNFNFGLPRGESDYDDNGSGGGGVRNQVLNAAIGATRVFSQFLGAAITGAAHQLQSFVRNSTKYVTGAVGG
ncbi:mucin-2-like [Microplitis mediator]|uniref:mucin-2-like n=1 Tax=Microplitis mediator TaxID=375433 RepID=UPI0025578561|nr:mucin-2-like [Microplitis mediator]